MRPTNPQAIPSAFRVVYPLLLLAIVLLSTVACIIGETTHSLYLEPDGAVTWVALARDVRSDRNNAAERDDEEASFLVAAQHMQQPIAEALRGLGAEDVQVNVVRDQRPFVVATQGQFASLEALLTRFASQLGIAASVRRVKEDDLHRLEISLSLNDEGGLDDEGEAEEPENEALLSLVDAADHYRIVLTEGTFVASVGFELEDDDTAAVPIDEASLRALDTDGDGVVALSLSWR